jgi:hypothetical protein
VNATKVNPPSPADGTIELIDKPLSVAVTGGSIEPIGIDLRGQNGEVAESTSGFLSRRFEDGAKNAETIAFHTGIFMFPAWIQDHDWILSFGRAPRTSKPPEATRPAISAML